MSDALLAHPALGVDSSEKVVSNADAPQKCAPASEAIARLEQRVKENLNRRLAEHKSYSVEEIKTVSELSCRLFPPNFQLTEAEEKMFRGLILRYRVSLRPAYGIKSHRKFIGPIIVRVKQVVWRVMEIFLRPTFEQTEDFHREMIKFYAEQIVQLRKINTIVKD